MEITIEVCPVLATTKPPISPEISPIALHPSSSKPSTNLIITLKWIATTPRKSDSRQKEIFKPITHKNTVGCSIKKPNQLTKYKEI